jgi:glycyl-tRNA synthetase
MSLLDQSRQDGKGNCLEITIGEAVEQGIVNNQTLGYFMARTQLFLVKIGCERSRIRFRQHKANEMAHYAQDCWDAEIKSSYGWIECVGHADRSAYDLKVHSAASNRDLSAREDFKVPQVELRPQAHLDNKNIKRDFARTQGPLRKFFKSATNEQLLELKANLEALEGDATYNLETGSTSYPLSSEHVSVRMREHKITGIKYIPSVIEPSFGLGRILYSLLEHAYTEREGTSKKGSDEKESYLKLSPLVAPTKAAILTQAVKPWALPQIADLSEKLSDVGLSYRVDNSTVSIGRKYARADEIGTPYSIVIDLQSNQDQKVTIRDRDTTEQVRVTRDRAVTIVRELCSARTTWEQVYATEEQFGRPNTAKTAE